MSQGRSISGATEVGFIPRLEMLYGGTLMASSLEKTQHVRTTACTISVIHRYAGGENIEDREATLSVCCGAV